MRVISTKELYERFSKNLQKNKLRSDPKIVATIWQSIFDCFSYMLKTLPARPVPRTKKGKARRFRFKFGHWFHFEVNMSMLLKEAWGYSDVIKKGGTLRVDEIINFKWVLKLIQNYEREIFEKEINEGRIVDISEWDSGTNNEFYRQGKTKRTKTKSS